MTRLFRSTLPALFVIFLFTGVFAGGDDEGWRPVPPDQLQMKTPLVEAEADAEAIFWEVRLDDRKRDKLFYNHYVRVKIFTERGREKFSKFDIPFMKGKKVEDVAARVIKPDGTIIELAPSDIFERDIIQYGKIRVRAKSFAVPGIEPGVIVEYRYKETFKGDSAEGERLFFQRDIPIQRATYAVRPYKGIALVYDFHNMPDTNFVEDGDGFYVATLTNVPAFKEEKVILRTIGTLISQEYPGELEVVVVVVSGEEQEANANASGRRSHGMSEGGGCRERIRPARRRQPPDV